MREILFRGKRLRNGQWAEGSLLAYADGTCFICCEDTVPDVLNKYEVDPDTVGQYTGVTDKNGKKIFEGDIVQYGDTYHEVVFEQRGGAAYFGLACSEWEALPFGQSQDLRQIEVVGNIHDNRERSQG